MKRLLYAFSASFLLIIFLTVGCTKKQTARKEKTVRVTVQSIEQRVFQDHLPIKGTVFPIDHATISAKTEGTLDDMKVDEGDRVKKGALLFSIDRLTLENAVTVKKEEVAVARTELSTSEIELKIAKTHFRKAKLDMERAKKLIKGRAMAETNYESAVVTLDASNGAVEKAKVAVQYRKAKLIQAETNLKIAVKNLHDAMVTAPYDCLVTEKLQEEGEYVKAGTNILKLENIKTLEVVAYLSASYHYRVIPGKTPAVISIDGRILGTTPVTYRAQTIDSTTRTFKIKIKLPPTIKISSGMLCNLDIILNSSKGWGVPETSVLQSGKRFYVFTAEKDSKAKSVLVKKGLVDQGYCQILNHERLKGKRVIVTGQRFVNDGDKLAVAE